MWWLAALKPKEWQNCPAKSAIPYNLLAFAHAGKMSMSIECPCGQNPGKPQHIYIQFTNHTAHTMCAVLAGDFLLALDNLINKYHASMYKPGYKPETCGKRNNNSITLQVPLPILIFKSIQEQQAGRTIGVIPWTRLLLSFPSLRCQRATAMPRDWRLFVVLGALDHVLCSGTRTCSNKANVATCKTT